MTSAASSPLQVPQQYSLQILAPAYSRQFCFAGHIKQALTNLMNVANLCLTAIWCEATPSLSWLWLGTGKACWPAKCLFWASIGKAVSQLTGTDWGRRLWLTAKHASLLEYAVKIAHPRFSLPSHIYQLSMEGSGSNFSCLPLPAGDMEVAITKIQISGQQLGEEDTVKEHLIKSPSTAANRMLQVRDYFCMPARTLGHWQHHSPAFQ